MFGWFKPTATAKSSIELKHSNGEILKITIEGSNVNQVNYVSNRIKETFKLKPGPQTPQKEIDALWKEFEGIFKGLDKMFGK